MVKSASAAFVLLLLGAHGVGEFSRRLAEPSWESQYERRVTVAGPGQISSGWMAA